MTERSEDFFVKDKQNPRLVPPPIRRVKNHPVTQNEDGGSDHVTCPAVFCSVRPERIPQADKANSEPATAQHLAGLRGSPDFGMSSRRRFGEDSKITSLAG